MHDELFVTPLILHRWHVPLNVLILVRIVGEETHRLHFFIHSCQDSNQVVEEEDVRNEDVYDE